MTELVVKVEHNGNTYYVDPEDTRPAHITYDGSQQGSLRGSVDYKYSLLHDGQTINILITNVRLEPGEYGLNVDYDKILWADDLTWFDDDLESAYVDALVSDMYVGLTEL